MPDRLSEVPCPRCGQPTQAPGPCTACMAGGPQSGAVTAQAAAAGPAAPAGDQLTPPDGRGGTDAHSATQPAPPADGTIAAARAAFDARTKLAHSKVSRNALVAALAQLGLALPGHTYEATANALIGALPVHDRCIAEHAWGEHGAVAQAQRAGWQ